MKEIKYLEDHGIVKGYDIILDYMSRSANKEIFSDDLSDSLEECDDVTYYNADSADHRDTTDDSKTAVLKLLKTTYYDEKHCAPLYLSFYRRSPADSWIGCFVGTMYKLHMTWRSRNELHANSATQKIDKAQYIENVKTIAKVNNEKSSRLQAIYDQLYYKESWLSRESYSRLSNYINSIKRKVSNEIAKGSTEFLLLNNDGTQGIFNSRLLDKFGNYIYLMASMSNSIIGDVQLFTGGPMFMQYNFEPRILDIPPVQFFNELSEVIFDGDLQSFDFSNSSALTHVIVERRNRLPEHVRSKSDMEIAQALKTAVEHGIRMSKLDYKFAVPMYNIENANIQFLLPMYFTFGGATEDTPDAVLVIDKLHGFWNIRTILEMEEAYNDARLISDPGSKWLRV